MSPTSEEFTEPDDFDNLILNENKKLRQVIAQKNNEIKLLQENFQNQTNELENEIKTLVSEN
jgi:hypothetical protein